MIDIEYRITNLADLIDMARAIQNEVNAAADMTVDPREIRVAGTEWAHITVTVNDKQQIDGSTVYDVEVS